MRMFCIFPDGSRFNTVQFTDGYTCFGIPDEDETHM